MDALASIRQTFFEECEEQLAELERGLIAMDEGATDSETINAVFRAVHSIKGGAGAFKLDRLVAFAHVFETVLDHIRGARLAASEDVLRVLLRSADVLSDLVRLSRNGDPIEDHLWAPLHDELEQLVAAPRSDGSDAADDEAVPDFQVATIDLGSFGAPVEGEPAKGRIFRIRFKAHAALYAKGNEAALLIRELSRLGTAQVECDLESVPSLDDFQLDEGYLTWRIVLDTTATETEVREVFEFVDGDCELDIAADPGSLDTPGATPELDLDAQLKALLDAVRSGEGPDAAPKQALPAPVAEDAAPSSAPKATTQDAARETASATAATAPATIRVDLDRVDKLINLVGELVINQAMLAQRVLAEGFASSSNVMIGLDELEHLTREIQESVMAIRAQPVRPLFQRMSRIVREVCEATGKDVRLKMEGDSTEVDKTVIERLADPLTHMIRNAVDHGIEARDVRLNANKPEEGTIRLSAAHRSGRVVIEISDDGGGIDRKRVLAKAVERGLVSPAAVLSDAEIDNLLFMPGFSTTEAVSSISGRGVGMDVVKRSIQSLGGRITINSVKGQGSTFSLSLPLTLAVLDGMVVSIAGQTLVVPLTAIVETLMPTSRNVFAIGEDSRVISIRGSFVPMIDVGYRLGLRGSLDSVTEGVAILVESESGARHALYVDAIQDQRQVVIKSLESNYGKIHGIAAATILGDGRVALILDVEALVCKTALAEPDYPVCDEFRGARAS